MYERGKKEERKRRSTDRWVRSAEDRVEYVQMYANASHIFFKLAGGRVGYVVGHGVGVVERKH